MKFDLTPPHLARPWGQSRLFGFRIRGEACSSGRTRSTCDTPSACASSQSVTTVGFRFPTSRPLRYCWLKP